jgi:hypothetical protein
MLEYNCGGPLWLDVLQWEWDIRTKGNSQKRVKGYQPQYYVTTPIGHSLWSRGIGYPEMRSGETYLHMYFCICPLDRTMSNLSVNGIMVNSD